MSQKVLLNAKEVNIILHRLACQLIENHNDFSNSAIIGLQPRGIYLANRLQEELKKITGIDVLTGALDITFYRDDFGRGDQPLIPSVTNLDFSIENKKVILVDDVLYTARTVRAGLDALMSFGRPAEVELMTFIDRRFSRHIPIQANYVGQSVDSIETEKVSVNWKETEGVDEVILYTTIEND